VSDRDDHIRLADAHLDAADRAVGQRHHDVQREVGRRLVGVRGRPGLEAALGVRRAPPPIDDDHDLVHLPLEPPPPPIAQFD